ncbi:putative amino acid permease YhdG [Lentilactobacillus hilgardii]|uniref:APC family permease n=1 Tax=Lentilactobacillus hilgardii TaxID=1588 RepID=UPI00019C50EE|nr:APC family permease [Lentilactobacillus hilgardii]EEI20123.1 amino acid permease [Lentilactobacillus buchneri ATCC 11577]MCT3396977.1 APC family permease [Lentilactobacillus hilgardii]QIR08791.1 putative amino acid permease YhdG [Lentilactobacillus hilgardii]
MASSLKKSIGFYGLISLGSGGVIGSSWIYTNSQFFKAYGAGGEIFGLMIAAVLAVMVSLSFAELSTIFTKSGGEVVYAYAAFGKKGALFAGWALIGSYLSILAFFVTASSLLISYLFPQISTGPYYTFAGVKVHYLELAIGIGITLFIFIVNYFGARLTGNVQIILLAGLIILGAILVVVGFIKGKPANFLPAFYPQQNSVPSVIRFVLPAMTFLTGWESVAIMAEEANIPKKLIGKVVVFSIIIAAIYYILVLLSSAFIHPWKQTANMDMGTIDAFKTAGFPLLGTFAFIISFLGLATSFLTLFAATPRLILSLARGNMLPAGLAKVHPKYGTPTNALWLVLALVLGIGWLGKGALIYFLDIGGFLIALAWSFNALSLFRIRKRYPTLKAGFRIKHLFFPVIGGLFAFSISAMTVIPGTPISLVWPYEYVVLGIWIILGLVGFLTGNRKKKVSDDFLGRSLQDLKSPVDKKSDH